MLSDSDNMIWVIMGDKGDMVGIWVRWGGFGYDDMGDDYILTNGLCAELGGPPSLLRSVLLPLSNLL